MFEVYLLGCHIYSKNACYTFTLTPIPNGGERSSLPIWGQSPGRQREHMVPIPTHFGPLTQSWRQGAEMGAGVKAWCHPFITQERGACCSQVMSSASITGVKYERTDPREWHLRTGMAPDGIAEIAAPFHFVGQQQKDESKPEWAPPLCTASFAVESCKPNLVDIYIHIYVAHKQHCGGRSLTWGQQVCPSHQSCPCSPEEPDWACRSQTQQCPAHTGCRCEKQLLTAGAGGWTKTLQTGWKMVGKESSLLWQEGSCSGDCTGRPGWGQKHFRAN